MNMFDPLFEVFRDNINPEIENIKIRYKRTWFRLFGKDIWPKRTMYISFAYPATMSEYIKYVQYNKKQDKEWRLKYFLNRFWYVQYNYFFKRELDEYDIALVLQKSNKLVMHIINTYFAWYLDWGKWSTQNNYLAIPYAYISSLMWIDVKTLLHTYTMPEIWYFSKWYIYNKNSEHKTTKKYNKWLFSEYNKKRNEEWLDTKTRSILDTIPK